MDTHTGELADIREQFIPKMPEMLLEPNGSTNGIKSKLRCLLALHGDCAIICEGLEGSSIFTLKHHVDLLPASVAVVSLLTVDVEGF